MHNIVRGYSANSDLEYGLAIRRGLVPGVSIVHKFGRNPDIDTASGFEDLWSGGGLYTGFNATAAEIVTVVSSSALDTAAGTGARTVELFGLGAGFVSQSEVVILNGVTPVSTVNSYLRLDVVLVLTAGTGGFNKGTITCRQSITTANIFAVMPIGGNDALIACYTVPAGKIGYVISGFATLSKKQTSASDIQASVRRPGSVFQIVEWLSINSTGTGAIERLFRVPRAAMAAGTDIKLAADASTNDAGVSGGFAIILVDV